MFRSVSVLIETSLVQNIEVLLRLYSCKDSRKTRFVPEYEYPEYTSATLRIR